MRRPLVLLGLAGLLLAGCSGTSSSSSTAAVSTTSVDLPPSYQFSPTHIQIARGATVTWTNHDNFTHSVQLLDGGLPADPHLMKPGEATTLAFASPGTYAYQCSLHPQSMRGSVTVTAP